MDRHSAASVSVFPDVEAPTWKPRNQNRIPDDRPILLQSFSKFVRRHRLHSCGCTLERSSGIVVRPPDVCEATMANDVQVITGTAAAAAARLCNFATGGSRLLPAHVNWLDTKVRQLVAGNPSAWVDVIGHASRQWRHTGGASSRDLNRALSMERCAAVQRQVSTYNPAVRFNVVMAQGTVRRSCRTPTTAMIGPWRC